MLYLCLNLASRARQLLTFGAKKCVKNSDESSSFQGLRMECLHRCQPLPESIQLSFPSLSTFSWERLNTFHMVNQHFVIIMTTLLVLSVELGDHWKCPTRYAVKGQNVKLMNRCGGQMVSVLTFNSVNPSSNLDEVYNFSLKMSRNLQTITRATCVVI